MENENILHQILGIVRNLDSGLNDLRLEVKEMKREIKKAYRAEDYLCEQIGTLRATCSGFERDIAEIKYKITRRDNPYFINPGITEIF